MDAITAKSSQPSLHLVGIGKVGRALLRELSNQNFRLIAVSDSKATLFRREGLDPLELLKHKDSGASVLDIPESKKIPLTLAADWIPADFVVDATPSVLEGARAKLAWYEKVLSRGGTLATAAKDALSIAPADFLSAERLESVGFNAALGGTGARLAEDLAWLREDCDEIALVSNASTGALIEAFEKGLDWDAALESSVERGILEPDPSADLDGTDAAVKLAVVTRVLWGSEFAFNEIKREDFSKLDLDRLRWRARHGLTTRLVGRASRGGSLQVRYEELSRSSALAVPSNRVAYSYRLRYGGLRLHIGFGIAPLATARAILKDLIRSKQKAGAA